MYVVYYYLDLQQMQMKREGYRRKLPRGLRASLNDVTFAARWFLHILPDYLQIVMSSLVCAVQTFHTGCYRLASDQRLPRGKLKELVRRICEWGSADSDTGAKDSSSSRTWAISRCNQMLDSANPTFHILRNYSIGAQTPGKTTNALPRLRRCHGRQEEG